jgi:hypothetical protein
MPTELPPAYKAARPRRALVSMAAARDSKVDSFKLIAHWVLI